MLFLLLGVIAGVGAVTELTDNNFLAYAQQKDVLLVDFYAPWCGDCKKLEPDFEGAANALGARNGDLVKVDCFGAGKGLCEMYGVKSWPQLKNFHKGQYTGDYTGVQTAEAIALYINTVENAASNPQQQPQQSNPYAMVYPIQMLAKLHTHESPIAPAPPPVGQATCAKCTINRQNKCSKVVKKACVELKLREKARKEEENKYEDDKKRTIGNGKKHKKKKNHH